MATPDSPLLRTPLNGEHHAAGGRMVPFGGWEMPLQYTSILAEARAVRSGVGIFDVSHMARLHVRGEDATAFLDRVLTARVSALRPGRARYTFLLNEDGGIIDDGVVARPDDGSGAEDHLLLVTNAGTRPAVLAWLERWSGEFPRQRLHDATTETAMVAVQGPQAAALLDSMADGKPSALRPFACATLTLTLSQRERGLARGDTLSQRERGLAGGDTLSQGERGLAGGDTLSQGERGLEGASQGAAVSAVVSRTGYTGEDGFEVVVASGDAVALWRRLVDGGAVACGLGSRDTLRLEAGLMLSGTDVGPSTTPLEAAQDRFVNLEKEGFVGREALLRMQAAGVPRRMVGFQVLAQGIPRTGYVLSKDGDPVGEVTSGGYSPTLDTAIGLGYVAIEHSTPGTDLTVDLRGRAAPAQVVRLPFYRRPQS